jgi:nucleoid-associated protein YgaU
VAAAERAARLRVERPWRVRGESGLSDWANDSYVVQPGDESLTAIAWLAYRDGTLWPKIWLANRDILPTPDRMEPGMELIIPPFAPLTPEERAAAREHRARTIRR